MLHRTSCGLAVFILSLAVNAGAQGNAPGEALPSGAAPAAPGAAVAQPMPSAPAPLAQPPGPQSTPEPSQVEPYATGPAPNQQTNSYGSGSTPPAVTNTANASTSGYDYNYAQQRNRVEPPPVETKEPFEWPIMSVRIDPLNWLLSGRLGLELESQVWKFVSVQLVPMFVVNDQPPYLNLNLSGVPNTLYQKSGGIGALAGTSIGVGFWLNGKPMEGYVLRAELTDYVIDYDTRDQSGPIDHVKYVDRAFQVLIGSHSKWGPVTLAGTFGLGSVLNKQNRCIDEFGAPSTSGCPNNKELSIRVTNSTSPVEVVNLHEWTYPIVLVVRISLGVVF